MVKIRELKPADFKNWLNVYQFYAKHYKVSLTDEGVKTTWNWLMNSLHPLKGIVANENTDIVGLAHFRAMPSPLRGKNIGFLDDIIVIPSYRGKGIAKLLLSELKKEGEKEGWGIIRWITKDDNYPAKALYDTISSKTNWNMYEMNCEF